MHVLNVVDLALWVTKIIHPTLLGMFRTLNDKMSEQITCQKMIEISAVNTYKSL